MKIKFILGMFLLSALSSCLTTFQPLVVKKNIITDDRLTGQWLDQNGKKIIVQKFLDSELKSIFKNSKESKEDSIYITKMYVIQMFDNNYRYIWIAGLVNIKDRKFINLFPIQCFEKDTLGIDMEGKGSSSIARIDFNNS